MQKLIACSREGKGREGLAGYYKGFRGVGGSGGGPSMLEIMFENNQLNTKHESFHTILNQMNLIDLFFLFQVIRFNL